MLGDAPAEVKVLRQGVDPDIPNLKEAKAEYAKLQ
jgi:hypothetical protein